MGRLSAIPFINIFDMANGNKYTTEDDRETLPPILAESDERTDKEYEERFGQKNSGNTGKRKGKGKSQFKVEKGQLNTEKEIPQQEKEGKEKGIQGDRGER